MDKTEIMSCRSILCMDRRAHQGQVWNVILFNMSADKLGTKVGVEQ